MRASAASASVWRSWRACCARGRADLDGTYWSAHQAELALAPDADRRPPIIVAAGGPRSMLVAARFGDAWNGFCPTDPESPVIDDLLALLDQQCAAVERDPSTIGRTFDVCVDPLDLAGARARSVEMLDKLRAVGADEVRCYPLAQPSHASRLEAAAALVELLTPHR